MTWQLIPGTDYEYDDSPVDPNNAQSDLWSKQVDGIRFNSFDNTEVYVKCRRVGTLVETIGELNKTFYDNRS